MYHPSVHCITTCAKYSASTILPLSQLNHAEQATISLVLFSSTVHISQQEWSTTGSFFALSLALVPILVAVVEVEAWVATKLGPEIVKSTWAVRELR